MTRSKTDVVGGFGGGVTGGYQRIRVTVPEVVCHTSGNSSVR